MKEVKRWYKGCGRFAHNWRRRPLFYGIGSFLFLLSFILLLSLELFFRRFSLGLGLAAIGLDLGDS